MGGGGIGDGGTDTSAAGDIGVESPPEPTSPEPGEGGESPEPTSSGPGEGGASPEPTSPGPSGGGDDGGRGEGHRGEGGGRGGAGEFGRDMGRVMSPEPTSLEPGGGGSEAAEAAAGSHIMESTAARSAQQQLRNNYGGTELENRD